MNTEQTFGEWVVHLRNNARQDRVLTQDELAAEMNISQSTISAVELNDRAPSEAFCIKLASVFDIDRDYVLYRAGYITESDTDERFADDIADDVEEFRRRLRAIDDPHEREIRLNMVWAALGGPTRKHRRYRQLVAH